eukprot:gene5618-6308_t
MAELNSCSWREKPKEESSDELETELEASRSNVATKRLKNKKKNGRKGRQERPMSEESSTKSNVKGTFEHPVFKEISKENGNINKMDIREVSRRLAACGLSNHGNFQVKQKRLKNWTRNEKLKEANVELPGKYKIDYYVVIDFEATCEKDNPSTFVQEIIEFPAVLAAEFHSYCRPVKNQKLTAFCTELTGITQDMVDSAPLFPTVLERFDEWLTSELQPTELFAVLTDGPWDMSRFMKDQCKLCKLDVPRYFKTWANIRKHFGNYYKVQRANLSEMLSNLGMSFKGRPHSGIDDARNIARIAIQLIKDGCDLKINESMESVGRR